MFVIRKLIPFAEKRLSFKSRILIIGTNGTESKGELSRYAFDSKSSLPPPPKKPLTAYLVFCKQNRSNVLKENPYLHASEQTKVLAEKWNNLTPSSRKMYEDIARESVISYAQLHKQYYESLTEEQREELVKLKAQKMETKKTSRLKRLLKKSGVPKSPSTAYILFLQDEAKGKNITSLPEFNKYVGAEWHKIPQSKREHYFELAKKEREIYESQLKEWREKLVNEGQEALLHAYNKKLKARNVASESSSPRITKAKDKSKEE